MKIFYLLISVTFITLLSACTNELDSVVPEVEKNNIAVLEFPTEADFILATQNPQKALEEVAQSNLTFKSLYDEYEDAWKVEEEYYASEAKYNEFKKLFPHLYFPEYEDDYSFFLPVSNEEFAKLLNPQGEVNIGGKLVSYIDIKTPQDLLKRGLLSTTKDEGIMTRTEQDNTVYLNHIPDVYGHEGDRKMWVHARKGVIGNRLATWVEVNFRKKGAFGRWKNYSSTVSLLGTLRYATGHSTIFTRAAVKDGRSPITFEAFEPNVGINPYPCTGKKLEIGYQGIGGLVYYLDVKKERDDE